MAKDYKNLCDTYFQYVPDMSIFNPVVIVKTPPEATRIFSIVVSLITDKIAEQTKEDSDQSIIPDSAKIGLFNSTSNIPSKYLYQIVKDDGSTSVDPNDPFKDTSFKNAAKLEKTTITTIISYMKNMLAFKNIVIDTEEKTDSSGNTYHHYTARWTYQVIE